MRLTKTIRLSTVILFVSLAGFSAIAKTLPVTIDPFKTLVSSASISKWKTAGAFYRINIKDGPDLDLGFNDYLDLRLKILEGYEGPIAIQYGTTDPASSNTLRSLAVPADKLLCDGNVHSYRLELGLEKFWRGTLTNLYISSALNPKITIEDIIVGDTEGDVYIPNIEVTPAGLYELSSKHFRFFWNKDRQKEGMNTTWAHGCLRNAEECWQFYVSRLGFPEPANKAPDGRKYKIQFSCIGSDYCAGGWGLNIGLTGLRVNPPTWIIPHEFMHTCQDFIKKDLNWWDLYEAHANYSAERWLQFYNTSFDHEAPPTTLDFINLVNFSLPHGRTYYACWPLFLYLDENPDNLAGLGNNLSTRMWQEQKEGEHWTETIKRLVPEVDFKDLIGFYARRRGFNYAHRPKSDAVERAPLHRRPDDPAWWQVSPEMAPMQMGFTVHELTPDAAATANVVSVIFKGDPDSERGADWRASLVAINANGQERYSRLWNAGENSIRLEKGDDKVLLVVAGTPDKIEKISFDDLACPYRTHPGKARLHYEVQIKGAKPSEPSRPEPAEWREHPNGGGKVEKSARVDPSAYVGPNALVLGSASVSGDARIEDYAVVTDEAKVWDHAVVSGHARITGSSIVKEYARVRDYAHVNDATISGDARILEHAVVNGALVREFATVKGRADQWKDEKAYVGGDAVLDGDHADGRKVINGFQYGHMPYEGDIWTTSRSAPHRIYAAYEFEISTANIARDAWGTTDGFIRGNPQWTEKDASRSGFITLNGESDYVVLDRQLVDFREITITAWINWAGGKPNQPVWFFGSSRDNYLWLTPDDGIKHARCIIRNDSALKTIFSNQPLQIGHWTHVAVTLDGKQGCLYINGILVCRAPVPLRPEEVLGPNINTAINHCYLGRSSDSSLPFFKGSLDSIRFYSKALTQKEITADMTPASTRQ